MSTITIILVITLSFTILAWLVFSIPPKRRSRSTMSIMTTHQRPLSADERQACEQYLAQLTPLYPSRLKRFLAFFGRRPSPRLTGGKQAYGLTHAITRYGLSTQFPQQWRYYLDAVEVHIPPKGEGLITTENRIELIYTDDIPVIFTLNNHSLLSGIMSTNTDLDSTVRIPPSASILKAESDNVELKQVRHQTIEEYQLAHHDGIAEAIVLCIGLFMLFISLVIPLSAMLWLLIPTSTLMGVTLWMLIRKPPDDLLREIKVLRGIPKRWGLFGEADIEDYSVSLGVIDLNYPDHWKPYLNYELGKPTEIEVDSDYWVVRQGEYLSLAYEAKTFPVQKWRKNLLLASGSLLVLLMSVSWLPIDMPFQITRSWLQGIQHVESTTINQLTQNSLKVGSVLRISGKGMCAVPPTYQSNRNYTYLPFDCSSIYWNQHQLPHLPTSEIINQTQALLATANRQLHPQDTTTPNINPQLAQAIQKSGMILLSDFTDIIDKTNTLCRRDSDCQRLKNALVNLENARDWPSLVQQSVQGKLTGLNVLLRPTSAQNLENLINDATASFISQETRRAIEKLNRLPEKGLLFTSDQGHQFIDQEAPEVPLFDLATSTQWKELQRLSAMLLNTPFQINGIITSVTQDTQGTLHITLHDEPSYLALWRYLIIALFFVGLSITLMINTVLGLRRLQADYQRSHAIKAYYNKCFASKSSESSITPKLF